MARLRSCDQHPPLPTTRTRWTRPAPPHDPVNRLFFAPDGQCLGFAVPPAATTAAPETEKESQ